MRRLTAPRIRGAGVVAMARGGGFNARWGNKLMRLRIIAQGAAVALLAVLAAVIW